MPYVTSTKAMDDMPVYPGVSGEVIPGKPMYIHESVRSAYVGNPDFTITEELPEIVSLTPTGLAIGGSEPTSAQRAQMREGIDISTLMFARMRAMSLSTIGAEGDSLVAGAAASASPMSQLVLRKSIGAATVGNKAVGGSQTSVIAGRLAALIALNPGAALLGGGVNDIISGVASETLKTRVIANIQTLLAAGIDVIDLGLPPTNTTANVPAYVKHEIWRRLWCAKNGVKHLDAWAKLATSTGGYAAGLNLDAEHYNTAGASLLVDDLDALWRSTVAPAVPLLAMTDTASDAATFVGNAISFTDTDANGIPNSWFAYGSGGTYSIQNADAGGFGKWARCAMAGGSSVGLNPTSVTLASLGWAIGDKLAVGMRIRTSDVSQALSVSAYLTGITTSSSQPLFNYKGGETGSDITVYGEVVITGGTTVNLQIFGSGTGYFEINRPVVVNLTSMGLA
jgi:hypothetical protein